MQISDNSKDIIVALINYFTTKQILGLTYAEAIDADTVVQLNITITNDLPDGDRNVPSTRISLLSCTNEDKTIIKQVLNFLNQEETTGFHYDMDLPDMGQKLHINVELKQISTK